MTEHTDGGKKKKKKKERKNIARSADLTRSVVQNVVLFLRYFIVSISNHDSTLSTDPLIFSTSLSLSLSLFSLHLKNRESDRIFKPFCYIRVHSPVRSNCLAFNDTIILVMRFLRCNPLLYNRELGKKVLGILLWKFFRLAGRRFKREKKKKKKKKRRMLNISFFMKQKFNLRVLSWDEILNSGNGTE